MRLAFPMGHCGKLSGSLSAGNLYIAFWDRKKEHIVIRKQAEMQPEAGELLAAGELND